MCNATACEPDVRNVSWVVGRSQHYRKGIPSLLDGSTWAPSLTWLLSQHSKLNLHRLSRTLEGRTTDVLLLMRLKPRASVEHRRRRRARSRQRLTAKTGRCLREFISLHGGVTPTVLRAEPVMCTQVQNVLHMTYETTAPGTGGMFLKLTLLQDLLTCRLPDH